MLSIEERKRRKAISDKKYRERIKKELGITKVARPPNLSRQEVEDYYVKNSENINSCLKVKKDYGNSYSDTGYFTINYKYKIYSLPRFILKNHYDNITSNIDTRHTCNNRWCINPEHLIPGTRQENVDDKKIHGTSGRKLTELKVKVIKSLLRQNRISKKEIARIFKVCVTTIEKISREELWKYVTI